MRVWICVLLLTTAGISTHATDWTALVKELQKSVVPIELDDRGVACTGFIIHANVKKDDEAKDYVLTAAHCEAAKMWADQTVASIVAKNSEKDLLVLMVDDLDRPALKLAKDNPSVGDEVVALGFGFGLERPLFRRSMISAETYIPYDGIGGPLWFVDAAFVGGMSGGPVVNGAGEVVMMVQRGTGSVGIGVGAETMRSRVGRYWQKPQP